MNNFGRYTLIGFLIFSLLFSPLLYAEDTQQDFDATKTQVNGLQATDPSLPTGVAQPKGRVGDILSKLFGADGKIGTRFLSIMGTGGTILPAYINGATITNLNANNITSGSIAGTIVSPNFGSQNIITTGSISAESINTLGISPTFTRLHTSPSGVVDVLNINRLNTTGVGSPTMGGSIIFNFEGDTEGTFIEGGRIISKRSGEFSINTDKIFINPTGLVGIGKTNPTQRLDVVGNVIATGFIGDGSALTNINVSTFGGQLPAYYLSATNINSGSLADARLSSNVALLTGTQTFTGVKTFSTTISGSISGNAGTATALATARNIAVTGDITGTTSFNGSANVSLTGTLANNSVITTKILDANVTLAKLAPNSVDSGKLVDASIVDADISATAAIGGTKISPNFGSQNIVTTGGVGVGTLAIVPGVKLQINGPVLLTDTNPSFVFIDTDTGADGYITANSASGSLALTADENNEVAGSRIAFNVDGVVTPKMVITGSGVAIGAVAPIRLLDIIQKTNGELGMRMEANWFANKGIVDLIPNYAGSGSLDVHIGKQTSDMGSRKFSFTGKGQLTVGIGAHAGMIYSSGSWATTTVPTSAFQILDTEVDGEWATASYLNNNMPSDLISLQNEGQVGKETWAGIYMSTKGGSNGSVRRGARIAVVPDMTKIFASDIVFSSVFETDGSLYEIMRLKGNNQSVGIGTITPTQKLDVSGNIRASGDIMATRICTSGGTGCVSLPLVATSIDGGGTANYVTRFTDANTLGIGKIFDNNTNVGIGITTPSEELTVSGSLLTTRDSIINGVNIGRGASNQSSSTAIGTNALSVDAGSNNTAVGWGSLQNNTSGQSNVSVGSFSLRDNTVGFMNVAMGYYTLGRNIDGDRNTAIGETALSFNTTGGGNTGIGTNALYSNTTGNNNTALGYAALHLNTTGSNNIAIGNAVNPASSTGSNQLNIGNWIYGDNGNIGIADSNPTERLDVTGNIRATGTFIGNGSTITNINGNNIQDNTIIKYISAKSGLVGPYAGYSGLGNNPGSLAGAIHNMILGQSAGYSLTSGSNNILLGQRAGYSISTGFNNVNIGANAGDSATTSTDNTFIGNAAGWKTTTGGSNTFVGGGAGAGNIGGTDNVALGNGALLSYNSQVIGSQNIGIGAGTRTMTGGTSNEIIVGYQAVGNGSNTVTLGNSSNTKTILTGNIGIGTISPQYNIDLVKDNTRAIYSASTYNAGTIWDGAEYRGGRARGTSTSPTHPLLGDYMVRLIGQNIITESGHSFMGIVASENHTAIANGSDINFFTTTNGGLVSYERMRILNNGNVGIGSSNPTEKLDVAGTTKLGTAGTAITNAGVCTIPSVAISTAATARTCTGMPASTSVAVVCSGAAAFTTPGTTQLYCRGNGTINSVTCNTSVANAVAMTYRCMWMQ